MIKRRALAVGLDGAFAGHSLRAGFATEGYAQGTPELAIMRHGRWRSASVMRGPPPTLAARNGAGEPGERHKAPALEILPALGRVSDITADNTSIDRLDAIQGSPHDIWLRRVGHGTDAGGSDAGVVSNRADRHRRRRPTFAAPVVNEFDAFDEDELLYVLVDYHRSPLGAWTAILVPDGLEPVALQATSAHDAFHKATELIEVLSEHADVAILTMHTLDGDPAAWATLAAREGFVDCAMSDNTLAALNTQN